MKAYKLLADHQGFAKDTIFYGPLPLQSTSTTKAYYPEESLDTVPGTNAFFESYVTSNPDIFEDMGETELPQPKK
jgi:hypothetical protein